MVLTNTKFYGSSKSKKGKRWSWTHTAGSCNRYVAGSSPWVTGSYGSSSKILPKDVHIATEEFQRSFNWNAASYNKKYLKLAVRKFHEKFWFAMHLRWLAGKTRQNSRNEGGGGNADINKKNICVKIYFLELKSTYEWYFIVRKVKRLKCYSPKLCRISHVIFSTQR